MARTKSSEQTQRRPSPERPGAPEPVLKPRRSPAPGSGASIVEFRGVSKRYPSGDLGLDHATFSVGRGEFVFLVGSTGSGKSTIMRLLLKEVDATEGTIR